MADVSISGAGAHGSAEATDRIPASKVGVKGYLTNALIRAYILGQENTWAERQLFGSNSPTDDNTAILIARGVTGDSIFAHAIRDESTMVFTTDGAYASYDATPDFQGEATHYNHLRGFQSRVNYTGTGTMGEVSDFWVQPTITGAVTNRYGLYVKDALGAGSLGTNYGIRIDALSRGGSNFAIYTAGSTQSYFGGAVEIDGQLSADGGIKMPSSFNTSGALLTTSSAAVVVHNAAATYANGVLKYGFGSGVAAIAKLQLGGATSSFPMLSREASSTVIKARLADDSDFAPIQGRLRAHANAAAETPTATHTLRVFDAAGTEYKVLAVAA